MKTLKESLLSDIEDNLTSGDDFVKGLDVEIENIQKKATKIKNWVTESKFSQLIQTKLYTEFDAKNILEYLGILSKSNKIVVVIDYLGKWPSGGNFKKHYDIYIGADYAGTKGKVIYNKKDVQVDNNMTHIKFIKQYVLPCFDDPETIKKLYIETNK